jgi:hypothetical protein
MTQFGQKGIKKNFLEIFGRAVSAFFRKSYTKKMPSFSE